MSTKLQTQAFLALVALLVPPAVGAFAPSISLRPSLSRGARFSATSCDVEHWGGIITMSAAHRCLDDIRTTTERVASLAEQVSIDEGALSRLARFVFPRFPPSSSLDLDGRIHLFPFSGKSLSHYGSPSSVCISTLAQVCVRCPLIYAPLPLFNKILRPSSSHFPHHRNFAHESKILSPALPTQ
jgi:hypothetical protein